MLVQPRIGKLEAFEVTISGIVQGVGFRPHIYRRAIELGLNGWVANSPEGVLLYLELESDRIEQAIHDLLLDLPEVARVDLWRINKVEPTHLQGFEICQTLSGGNFAAEMSPDLAVCADCLTEMRDPGNRRFAYPYISCTNCGPRYSVMTSLPYDRKNTTMRTWKMCQQCDEEYRNPYDRRYHAEPIACFECGPVFNLYEVDADGSSFVIREGSAKSIIDSIVILLESGGIAAIKGIGGYHLACDAFDAKAVKRLRDLKFRKEKPFALLVKNIEVAKKLCEVSGSAEQLLGSRSAPIVLLPETNTIEGIAPDAARLGIMLPYTPVQHLLFDYGAPEVLVMTSGNRSSEPITIDDDEALDRFLGIADAVLVGERAIARRLDDSVLELGDAPRFIRRSRGYAPSFVTKIEAQGTFLGVGSDLKSTVSLLVDNKALISQYLGDLSYFEVQESHKKTVNDLLDLYSVDPSSVTICADLHPGYYSTRLASEYSSDFNAKSPYFFQHHRAHIASVLAEANVWEANVVGVALDGTGYGDDGTIWGGEFFFGSMNDGFTRIASLEQGVLLGGDAAAQRPLQALAGLISSDAVWELLGSDIFGVAPDSFKTTSSLRASLGQTSTKTSSAGRLFDSFAAICGFVRPMTYEGQAAMWLESLAASLEDKQKKNVSPYYFSFDQSVMSYQGALGQAITDRLNGVSPALIAGRFHAGFCDAIANLVLNAVTLYQVDTVVLAGGVFQNQILSREIISNLSGNHIQVLANRRLSCNDENISLGQIALASFGNVHTQTLGKSERVES